MPGGLVWAIQCVFSLLVAQLFLANRNESPATTRFSGFAG